MDASRPPAEEAMDQVVAGLEGPVPRKELLAAAAALYRGDARSPAQALATHLRFRGDLVQTQAGVFERLDRIMDGVCFRLTLTPALLAVPSVPRTFFDGYVGQRRAQVDVVDGTTGRALPRMDREEMSEAARRFEREQASRRRRRVPDLTRAPTRDDLILAVTGGLPAPWGAILSWHGFAPEIEWVDLRPIVQRHRSRAGDSLFFVVESALDDRVSVTFHRKQQGEDSELPGRNQEVADRLAALLEGERNEIPAREAVPRVYLGLPWARDPGCPAEHWWVTAEADPRLRVVDGKALASSSYWRREDEGSGRPRPQRPDVSEAPPDEAGKEYLLKVSLKWQPGVWRTIALRGEQTLDDLHDAIQGAFGWDNDHLYAFYMSNKAWDDTSEYGDRRGGDAEAFADEAVIGALGIRPNKPFLYIFDFGDDLRHEIRLVSAGEASPRKKYPRVVEKHGRAPRQYSDEW